MSGHMTDKQKRTKDLYLRRTYHITLERYNELRKAQKYACAICQKHESEFKNSLAVDHDHITGEVRGLLCWQCNRSLGKFRDHMENLQRAAAYVTLPPLQKLVGVKVFTCPGRVGTKARLKLLKKFNASLT
jgi:hypothetical protein